VKLRWLFLGSAVVLAGGAMLVSAGSAKASGNAPNSLQAFSGLSPTAVLRVLRPLWEATPEQWAAYGGDAGGIAATMLDKLYPFSGADGETPTPTQAKALAKATDAVMALMGGA
jgi:hypothetical protein